STSWRFPARMPTVLEQSQCHGAGTQIVWEGLNASMEMGRNARAPGINSSRLTPFALERCAPSGSQKKGEQQKRLTIGAHRLPSAGNTCRCAFALNTRDLRHAERGIPVSHQQDRIGLHTERPSADADNEIEECTRISPREHDREPGDHDREDSEPSTASTTAFG